MALEKSTFSLNLGNGIDQKSDNKVGRDDQFTAMKDWIYQKVGKLYKRFGTDRYVQTVSTTYPNPLSIGTTAIPSSQFSYKDQLCIQNKGALYSWSANQSAWQFKGHHYPIEIESKITVSSELQYYQPTSYYVNNLRILVYLANDPTNPGPSVLKYTVIEHTTGLILIDDITIDTITFSSSAQTFVQQVVSFASRTYLIYQNAANIKIAEFNLTTGSLGSTSNLRTDMAGSSGWFNILASVVTNKTGVGERALITYYNTSNQLCIFALTNAGAVDGSIPVYTAAITLSCGFFLEYNTATDILFVGYQDGSFNNTVKTFSFTSTTLVLNSTISLGAITVNPFYGNAISMDLCKSPINTNEVLVMICFANENKYTLNNLATSPEHIIYTGVVNTTSVVTGLSYYCGGYFIAAKSYSDVERKTIYSFLMNCTGSQQTIFMIDRLKGKVENAPYVQAKINYGSVYRQYNAAIIPQMSLIGNKLYFGINRIVDASVGNPQAAILFNGTQSQYYGIGEAFIDLKPTLSASYVTLSDAAHTSGGYLGYYDGSDFVESGFFLDPELIEVNKVGVSAAKIKITVTQQGTASLPEITLFEFYNGSLNLTGPTYYFTFNTPTVSYIAYFVIDGVGSAPAVAGTKIAISINSSDTAEQVRNKAYTAMSVPGVILNYSGTNNITVQNSAVGAVTDASNANYIGSYLASLGAGSYQYVAVWKYFDVNGKVIKSAPSLPVTITTVANDIVGLSCFVPNLTNRNMSSIRIEWYRTLANGTLFYKLNNLYEEQKWSNLKWNSGFLDIKPDASLTAAPELLYTTGNILDNYQIPSVKHVSVFKNRIIASGLEDPTKFYYSKTAQYGAAVEFAQELYVQVDLDSDPITGHAQLDDKLIIFKRTKIYYLAGDGANDTGTNESFSLPTLVATDVGCIGHNTIVKTPLGLMFKSQKGIYLLDRSLQLTYIGKEVEDYNDLTLMSGALLPKDNQVRFNVKTGDALVYDYLFNRWTIFSQYYGDACCIWQDKFSRIDSDGFVYVENEAQWKDVGSTTPSYSPTFSTKWLQVKDMQQFSRIYKLAILGDLKSAHTLNYKLYYDYDDTNYDEYNFASSNVSGVGYDDSVYQPIIHLKRQKCDAMLVKITCIPSGGTEESLQLVDMSFTVGLKQGLQKVRAEKKL